MNAGQQGEEVKGKERTPRRGYAEMDLVSKMIDDAQSSRSKTVKRLKC